MADGLRVILVMNIYRDNETKGLSVTEILEMIERSCGEKVFGEGGFIHDIIVNDWARTEARNPALKMMAM